MYVVPVEKTELRGHKLKHVAELLGEIKERTHDEGKAGEKVAEKNDIREKQIKK